MTRDLIFHRLLIRPLGKLEHTQQVARPLFGERTLGKVSVQLDVGTPGSRSSFESVLIPSSASSPAQRGPAEE